MIPGELVHSAAAPPVLQVPRGPVPAAPRQLGLMLLGMLHVESLWCVVSPSAVIIESMGELVADGETDTWYLVRIVFYSGVCPRLPP